MPKHPNSWVRKTGSNLYLNGKDVVTMETGAGKNAATVNINTGSVVSIASVAIAGLSVGDILELKAYMSGVQLTNTSANNLNLWRASGGAQLLDLDRDSTWNTGTNPLWYGYCGVNHYPQICISRLFEVSGAGDVTPFLQGQVTANTLQLAAGGGVISYIIRRKL